MYEIYDRHASRYDDLVSCEDHAGNLRRTVRTKFNWNGVTVVEAGIGTGRVTRMYVDQAANVSGFDRSGHMLTQAARNLHRWSEKLVLQQAEHRALPLPDSVADVFIEGWAFGHAVTDQPESVGTVVADLIREAQRVTRPGGTVILMETLGTNVRAPAAPDPALAEFYELLETVYGFEGEIVRTDYRFESRARAAKVCGFFFGDEMRDAILADQHAPVTARRGTENDVTIPEFTGLWSRRM